MKPQPGFKPIDPAELRKLRGYAEDAMKGRGLPHKKMLRRPLPYHNWYHVRQFMQDADFLAKGEGLGPEARENIMIAAMFHDIGNLISRKGHEEIGRQILHDILSGTLLRPRSAEIERLVIATDFTREPKTLDERIMRDADIASKGKRFLNGFFYQGRKLKTEMMESGSFPKEELEWFKLCKQILSIPFYTKTAQARWEKGRQKNLFTADRKIRYREMRAAGTRPVKALVKSRKIERQRAK